MNYFIFGYAETVLVECTPLVSSNPVGLSGVYAPVEASTPPAVAGVYFWNAYDEANGNYFVYDAKKDLVVKNTNATDSVTLTIKTKDYVSGGLEHVVEDFVKVIGPEEEFTSGVLSSSFNDANKVKITLADISSGDALGDCFLAVVKRS